MPDYIKTLPVVALDTFLIFVFLILGFRFLGRRQTGQLTAPDLVIIIVMGSAVETALIHGNVSLPAGLVSAATLLLSDRLVSFLTARSKRLRRLVSGGPTLLVHHGEFVEENLRRAGLTRADVEEAIRERGCAGLEETRFAVMEEDGEINIVPREARTFRSAPLAAPSSEPERS